MEASLEERLYVLGVFPTREHAAAFAATACREAVEMATTRLAFAVCTQGVRDRAAYFLACLRDWQPTPGAAAAAPAKKDETPHSAAYSRVEMPRPRAGCPRCHGTGYVDLPGGRKGGLCDCIPYRGV